MGKLGFLHLDTLGSVWGNGITASYNDTVKRININASSGVDASNNLKNSNGDVIQYIGDGFPTSRPVRLVMPKNIGTTNYLDLLTANGAVFPAISGRAIISGGELITNFTSLRLLSTFFWLNETPRKSDGSYATTDGLPYDGTNADDVNAVYYEAILIGKTHNAPFHFSGFGFKTISNIFNVNSGFKRFFSFLNLNQNTGASESIGASGNVGYGVAFQKGSSNTVYHIQSFGSIANMTQSVSSSSTGDRVNSENSANDNISFEYSLSGIALVNRTEDRIVNVQRSNSYLNGSDFVVPVVSFWGESEQNMNFDDLFLIGFDEILSI